MTAAAGAPRGRGIIVRWPNAPFPLSFSSRERPSPGA
jgi:hypothetical protein